MLGVDAGLTKLTWPAASTAQEAQQLLNRQLASNTTGGRWQALLTRGDETAVCAGKPAFTVQDPTGERWQLAFVESGLPTTAMALGEQRPILRGLQQYLHGRGWLVANSVDGVMGPRTVAALGRFQAEERLPGTGQFDTATAYRLSCRLPAQVLAAAAAAGV
jgi:peptidoglycan hydrolase-like protein with peptidoglycan-binding domain